VGPHPPTHATHTLRVALPHAGYARGFTLPLRVPVTVYLRAFLFYITYIPTVHFDGSTVPDVRIYTTLFYLTLFPFTRFPALTHTTDLRITACSLPIPVVPTVTLPWTTLIYGPCTPLPVGHYHLPLHSDIVTVVDYTTFTITGSVPHVYAPLVYSFTHLHGYLRYHLPGLPPCPIPTPHFTHLPVPDGRTTGYGWTWTWTIWLTYITVTKR